MKQLMTGGIDNDRLRSYVERLERLETEKREIQGDIRDVLAEAQSVGYDVKVIRIILKLRKMNPADRDEQEALTETCRRALDF